ncbi:MAG: glycosyltransferase [Erysipelotrichaceae bacterium]
MEKKISVVMTTYNGQKYLTEQLDSLRNQTLRIDEAIIMDDCSTDQTLEIIRTYIKKYNLNNWKIFQNDKNIGWKKNFKTGFDLSKGYYIFPCDQDDIWHLDKVQKMVECMELNPNLEVLAANYTIFFSGKDNGHGSRVYASRSNKMKNDGHIEILGIDAKWPYINRPGCTFCFKRLFYESIKNEWDTRFAHDAILWRFARMDNALGLLHCSLIDFRRHGDNVTSTDKRTKESSLQTFDDYIYFHETGLKRVKSEEDKEKLKMGIDFLELRKEFYKTANFPIWIKLVYKYHSFYNSFKGCLRDLYIVYK